jgi:hypothetical protein
VTQSLEGFFDVTNPVDDPVMVDIKAMMYQRYKATPRHLQVELGPSEIPHPCRRKLAYGLMAIPGCNIDSDPLPSIVGTAAHTWMESAARLANERLGRERWLIESRVKVDDTLSGSCDLYDKDTFTVIDHKFPGTNRFDMYKKHMSPIFIGQVNLYGYGFEKAGHPVKDVAIALFPRGGRLKNMHLWKQPYNPELARQILARRDEVIALCNDLEVENNPERYHWIQETPVDCIWCEWFSRTPRGPLQCGGDRA